MTFGPRETDLLLSDWIAAEAIFHLKNTSYWTKPDWVSNTKIHKIIYNVVEKNELPVTTSWYMHGAFVHDYNSLGLNFEKFVSHCIGLKRGPIRYRSRVREILENFDDVYVDIIYFSDIINSYSSNDYLDYLYHYEVPDKYAPSYLAKHAIFGDRGNLTSLMNYLTIGLLEDLEDTEDPLDIINGIYNDISDFNSTVYKLYQDKLIERNARIFFDSLEECLNKLEYLLKRGSVLSTGSGSIINIFKNNFIWGVWRPYACYITRDTVTGPWEETVKKRRVVSWRSDALSDYLKNKSQMDLFLSTLNLHMNYEDYKFILRDDGPLSASILKLLKTYTRRSD
jgi:hypothetical protein